jgi:hypothetical protein
VFGGSSGWGRDDSEPWTSACQAGPSISRGSTTPQSQSHSIRVEILAVMAVIIHDLRRVLVVIEIFRPMRVKPATDTFALQSPTSNTVRELQGFRRFDGWAERIAKPAPQPPANTNRAQQSSFSRGEGRSWAMGLKDTQSFVTHLRRDTRYRRSIPAN